MDKTYTVKERTIIFERDFNQTIESQIEIMRIHCIDSICFNCEYYEQRIHFLPDFIIGIKTSARFNRQFIFSKNVETVIVDNSFNQPVVLSKKLLKFKCGDAFKKSINISKNLIVLYLGGWFNNRIVLTKNIRKITFGTMFDQSVVVSKNVRVLRFDHMFNQPLEISKTMVYMRIGYRYDKQLVLSKGLRTLWICSKFPHSLIVPTHLKMLGIGLLPNQHIVLNESLEQLEVWPEGLNVCNRIFDNLTNSLKKISTDHLENIVDVNLPNCGVILGCASDY